MPHPTHGLSPIHRLAAQERLARCATAIEKRARRLEVLDRRRAPLREPRLEPVGVELRKLIIALTSGNPGAIRAARVDTFESITLLLADLEGASDRDPRDILAWPR